MTKSRALRLAVIINMTPNEGGVMTLLSSHLVSAAVCVYLFYFLKILNNK